MIDTARAARPAASLSTMVYVQWNAGVPAWFGVAYITEQYLALILGLSLCALFLSTRVSRAKWPTAPWWDVALAATALTACLYLVFRFPAVIDQLAFRPAHLVLLGGLMLLLVLEAVRRDRGRPASKKKLPSGRIILFKANTKLPSLPEPITNIVEILWVMVTSKVRLTGQSKAGTDGEQAIDELIFATVASFKDAVQE